MEGVITSFLMSFISLVPWPLHLAFVTCNTKARLLQVTKAGRGGLGMRLEFHLIRLLLGGHHAHAASHAMIWLHGTNSYMVICNPPQRWRVSTTTLPKLMLTHQALFRL